MLPELNLISIAYILCASMKISAEACSCFDWNIVSKHSNILWRQWHPESADEDSFASLYGMWIVYLYLKGWTLDLWCVVLWEQLYTELVSLIGECCKGNKETCQSLHLHSWSKRHEALYLLGSGLLNGHAHWSMSPLWRSAQPRSAVQMVKQLFSSWLA